MSTFARRSLHATAAAAGIAALGVGIAGPALAAPGVPDFPALPGSDALSVPQAPDMGSFADLGAPMDTHDLAALPDAFSVPTVDSMAMPAAAPDLTAAEMPSAPSTEGLVTMHGGLGQVHGLPTAEDAPRLMDSNDIAGLPSPDHAAMLTDFASKGMSGRSITSNVAP